MVSRQSHWCNLHPLDDISEKEMILTNVLGKPSRHLQGEKSPIGFFAQNSSRDEIFITCSYQYEPKNEDFMDTLRKLATLKNEGIITQEEFEARNSNPQGLGLALPNTQFRLKKLSKTTGSVSMLCMTRSVGVPAAKKSMKPTRIMTSYSPRALSSMMNAAPIFC